MIKLANAPRFLAVDMVEKAKSGHPGMPMGMADIITVLYKDFLKFNPKDPKWPNRDRFILSNGHGCALLYSVLYLTGYEKMTLDELKTFRQLNSICAGHPEFHPEAGIEMNTGPLGQGIATAVGMALAERNLNARFGEDLVSHKTYVFCGDGCLAEGVGQEAIALAGHLRLKNLIIIFDDNGVTIDGPTSLATSENHMMRFEAAGFATIKIDGHDHASIKDALQKAQNSEKPVFIAAKTTIGFGSPNKGGSAVAHGSPLGEEESKLAKEKLGWDALPFEVPAEIMDSWRGFSKRCEEEYKKWQHNFKENGSELKKFLSKFEVKKADSLLEDFKLSLYSADAKEEATRVSSGKVLEQLIPNVANLIGGSADLTPSNCTKDKSMQAFSYDNPAGRYIHYGEREHLMAAMMNGMSLYGGFVPYGGTFLVFTDYCRPAIRLAAMMKRQLVYVMTHDSIGLGEDGPTHQPVEHLPSLRCIPNLRVFRPCDDIETIECWQLALQSHASPSLLALTRQNLPRLRGNYESTNLSSYGGYILREYENELDVTIFATGSEVSIALEVAEKLEKSDLGVRVVSVPCIELLFEQDPEYVMMLTCNKSLKVAIEAAKGMGWERLIGSHGVFFGVEEFGHSAPYKDLYKFFGLEPGNIAARIKTILKK